MHASQNTHDLNQIGLMILVQRKREVILFRGGLKNLKVREAIGLRTRNAVANTTGGSG